MSTYSLGEKEHTTDETTVVPQGDTGFNNALYYRLIEKCFPTVDLSEESSAERYQSGKTAHTIFTWWARRPFAAMRGILVASLIKYKDQHDLASLISRGCGRKSEGLWSLGDADQFIDPKTQRVLDVFAGGATIPIEAASIGMRAYALDNNELAHFIQIALLKLSQVRFDLPALIEAHGKSLLNQFTNETSRFFPHRDSTRGEHTIAYFWSRSVKCPSCKASLSLLKRPWFSKKNGKSIFLQRTPDYENRCFTRRLATSGEPADAVNAWQSKVIKCPFCQHVIDRENMDAVLTEYAYDELTAYCTSQRPGKSFYICEDEAELIPTEDWLREQIDSDLAALGRALPESQLPRWSGITNPTLYGIHKISDLFNTRQLAVLVRCCRLLRDEYNKCARLHGVEIAMAIVAFLSGLIDQLVDWNGRICMWISQNEQVGRGYSGPGIPMMWDFVEIDPLCDGPANLWDKLERIIEGLKSIPQFSYLPEVLKGDASSLPFPDQYFDIVATDPPYFDNLYYNILADCIYVWKRLALADIFPEVFTPEITDVEHELTASKYRHGTPEDAAKFYTDGMTRALAEVQRVLKHDGVLAFVFAHSSVGGWTSVVEAFRSASLDMVAAWEMQVERKHRPRGMNSDAVNTSFVLVGKKHSGEWRKIAWEDLVPLLAHRLTREHERLLTTGWSNDDVGWSLFGIAACAYAQAGEVSENGSILSSQQVLERIAKHVEARIPGFAIARR